MSGDKSEKAREDALQGIARLLDFLVSLYLPYPQERRARQKMKRLLAEIVRHVEEI